jgi:hypothetical protein
MDRLSIAYLLIALIALALAGAIAFRIFYSRDRTYQRRKRRRRAERDFNKDAE